MLPNSEIPHPKSEISSNSDIPPKSDIHAALEWLTTLLDRYQVPYQVVGGLAAQAYGATRPLVDVDLYVPFDQAQDVLAEIQPFIVRPPGPHVSAAWDLVYLALVYEGTYIEIGDSSSTPKFYNRRDGGWEEQIIDYSASVRARLYEVDLFVMPKAGLLDYKAKLDREVDYLDIEEMRKSNVDNLPSPLA